MENKYYAIKIGKNVKDIIVSDWEVCKMYVIDSPAIYQEFKNKKEAKKYLQSINEIEVKNILLNQEIERFRCLKEKIEYQYGFHVPNYIIDEIINNSNYNNLCSLVNLAILKNRLTKEQGKIIKQENQNMKF